MLILIWISHPYCKINSYEWNKCVDNCFDIIYCWQNIVRKETTNTMEQIVLFKLHFLENFKSMSQLGIRHTPTCQLRSLCLQQQY